MKKIFYLLTIITVLLNTASFAQKKNIVVKKKVTIKAKPAFKAPIIKKIPGTRVKITTDSGVIIVRLYDGTPKHRDNFIKLVNEKFYDSLLFHRVINAFMIQGGDPESRTAPSGVMLGNGSNGYTIPAEFDTNYFHKKGVLAAARTQNPEKASSGCQFYLVQGKTFTDQELDVAEQRIGYKYSLEKRNIYKTIGGTPWLDNNYTIFGEVEKGLEVIDKIAKMPNDVNNRPFTDIRMKMEIMK